MNKKYSDAGKGDKSRVKISPKEWAKRWEKIFKKGKKKDLTCITFYC